MYIELCDRILISLVSTFHLPLNHFYGLSNTPISKPKELKKKQTILLNNTRNLSVDLDQQKFSNSNMDYECRVGRCWIFIIGMNAFIECHSELNNIRLISISGFRYSRTHQKKNHFHFHCDHVLLVYDICLTKPTSNTFTPVSH